VLRDDLPDLPSDRKAGMNANIVQGTGHHGDEKLEQDTSSVMQAKKISSHSAIIDAIGSIATVPEDTRDDKKKDMKADSGMALTIAPEAPKLPGGIPGAAGVVVVGAMSDTSNDKSGAKKEDPVEIDASEESLMDDEKGQNDDPPARNRDVIVHSSSHVSGHEALADEDRSTTDKAVSAGSTESKDEDGIESVGQKSNTHDEE
jgi:hypothetical protein